MSRRMAAYAVCVEDGRVLLARYVSPYGDGSWWTLPGGGVELGEDPFDTVTREVAEETGYESVVESLLGVALAQTRPPTGHVPPVEVGALIRY